MRAPHLGDAFANAKRLMRMRLWGSFFISSRLPRAIAHWPPVSAHTSVLLTRSLAATFERIIRLTERLPTDFARTKNV